MRTLLCGLAALGASLVARSAPATWSILLVDLSTGEIAVGSATCLTGFDLQVNTPVLIPGVGAASAQSFVDTNGFNRALIRDRLLEGLTPAMVLDELSVFDGSHQTRQYGMVDVLGNAETFTGTGTGQWSGGLTDLSAWLAAYLAGAPSADRKFDGVISPADFNAWVLNRNRACN